MASGGWKTQNRAQRQWERGPVARGEGSCQGATPQGEVQGRVAGQYLVQRVQVVQGDVAVEGGAQGHMGKVKNTVAEGAEGRMGE